MIHILIFLIGGAALLYGGAELLIRGSSSLALRLGLTPLVIGLTVVAFGTSSPELVVSIKTNLAHQGGIAIGNIIGSNIFNIAIILGLSALIRPLIIKPQLIKFDMPVVFVASSMFCFMFADKTISKGEAGWLLGGIILYTLLSYYKARHSPQPELESVSKEDLPPVTPSLFYDLLYICVGLIILVLGSRIFIHGAVRLAKLLGMSEAIIGLTIVAAGTSLPELATSLVAAFRKQHEIAVGNIIGSNIFNIFCILGIAGLLTPINGANTGLTGIDLAMMMMILVILFSMMFMGKRHAERRLERWEGFVLFLCYCGYLYLRWPKP